MRSPTLIMFVFAMICCFNICDVAGNNSHAISTLKDNVEEGMESFVQWFDKQSTVIASQLKLIQDNLIKAVNLIVKDFMLTIKKYRKVAKKVNPNHCLMLARRNLTMEKNELRQQFDDFIKKEKQVKNHIEFNEDIIEIGTSIVTECNNLLKNHTTEILPEYIRNKFVDFKNKVATEKKAIETAITAVTENAQSHASDIRTDLQEQCKNWEAKVRRCISMHHNQ